MGAILTDKVPILEILKPTGYNCPEKLMGKTWGDVIKSGGGASISVEENKAASITSNGTSVINPTAGKDAMAKVTVTVDVNSKLYAWAFDNQKEVLTHYTLSATPAVGAKVLAGSATGAVQALEVTAVGDEYATISTSDDTTFSRYPDGDLTL